MKDISELKSVMDVLPTRLQELFSGIDRSLLCELEEIRLRRERPVSLTLRNRNVFFNENGSFSVFESGAVKLTCLDMDEVYLKLCRNSVYSYQKDIAQGFITLDGGHRAGFCGSFVTGENGMITGIKDISTINIRIARQVKGCAQEAFKALYESNAVCSALIISPPKCGKTTMLRDLARLISENGAKVCIIDERSEIASMHHGIPCCDVGPCTEIYDGMEKCEGILRALRTMSPDVIICDEIGSEGEAVSIKGALNCGVPVIASAHAQDMQELLKRESMKRLICSGAFRKVISLSSDYKITNIHDIDQGGVNGFEKFGGNADVFVGSGGRSISF